MVAGGGGDDVAIERPTGKKANMKQATLGVGVGLGIHGGSGRARALRRIALALLACHATASATEHAPI